MAATVTVAETNGDSGSPSTTDSVTNMNFGSTDATSLTVATYPITIPAAGTNYSYDKYFRLKVGGTFNTVDNFQFWKSSGAYVTGEDIYGSQGDTTTAYVTPQNASANAKADASIPTADPGGASSGNISKGGSLTGQFTGSTGGYTDYLILQMRIASTASPGNVNQKQFTFSYDEA